MKMVKVKSSNIEQVGFEEKVTVSFNKKPMSILRVIFTSGYTYDYYRVPKKEYEELIEADSVGIYFHKNIKNKYDYEKK